MAEIGRWNEHKFIVSPEVIRSFIDLQIKGSAETKDKKKSKQQYVKRKSGKPVEITLTVKLTAALGCDVKAEALAFVNDAKAGKKGYFYLAGKKLVTCKVMLTDATVKETEILPGGEWVRADVTLTMKQAAKGDANAKSGKKKSKKKSVRKTGTKTTRKTGNTGGSGGSKSGKSSGGKKTIDENGRVGGSSGKKSTDNNGNSLRSTTIKAVKTINKLLINGKRDTIQKKSASTTSGAGRR